MSEIDENDAMYQYGWRGTRGVVKDDLTVDLSLPKNECGKITLGGQWEVELFCDRIGRLRLSVPKEAVEDGWVKIRCTSYPG